MIGDHLAMCGHSVGCTIYAVQLLFEMQHLCLHACLGPSNANWAHAGECWHAKNAISTAKEQIMRGLDGHTCLGDATDTAVCDCISVLTEG